MNINIFHKSYQYYKNNKFFGQQSPPIVSLFEYMHKHKLRGARCFFKQVTVKLSI